MNLDLDCENCGETMTDENITDGSIITCPECSNRYVLNPIEIPGSF